MDYSKLADEFIEEGAWQGAPVIAVSMFAKWLEEREAAQPRVQLTGGTCASCGEGNVVYDGCCINCGVPATSN